MKAFLAGLVAAVVVAVVAGILAASIDMPSRDVYQSHQGSVRLSAN